ncbi:unnamed protein product, partial [Prorocentrum cordatum]
PFWLKPFRFHLSDCQARCGPGVGAANIERPRATADDDEPTFDTVESGSSHTYPQQCGELRRGSMGMIKGKACKVAEISTSKTGKHGHAKAHIVALDSFTGKKCEDLCPTSHNMEIPFTKRTEYQLLSADESTGEVSLLLESGETKDDLNLPTFVKTGEPTDEDKKVVEDILKMQEPFWLKPFRFHLSDCQARCRGPGAGAAAVERPISLQEAGAPQWPTRRGPGACRRGGLPQACGEAPVSAGARLGGPAPHTLLSQGSSQEAPRVPPEAPRIDFGGTPTLQSAPLLERSGERRTI